MFSLIYFLLIGLAAGWTATRFMGGDAGVLKMMLFGVIGSYVGGFLIYLAGFSKGAGLVPSLITATLGAVVCIALVRRFG